MADSIPAPERATTVAAAARTHLGTYLRGRRASVDPEDVGLPRGRRRVSGLRREEVATLAGVSGDYYTRLEQGRERHPSVQALDALSRVLRLDSEERAHLHLLAGAERATDDPGEDTEAARPLVGLLDQWTMHPAFVFDDTQEILAANALGRALHAGFARADNFARMVFTDPEGRRFFVEWERIARDTTATLRRAWAHPARRDRVQRLVDELRSCDGFAAMWDAHSVVSKSHETKALRHHLVGPLELDYHTFSVTGTGEHHLLVCRAAPGTPSETALARLASSTPGS